MTPTPQQLIEVILQRLKEKGRAAAPVEEAHALAINAPEAIYDLAIAVMRDFPPGGTFLDGALSFMPDDLWPALIEQALNTIESSNETNDAAESVIAYASLQAPRALHPYLDRIFDLQPNSGTYYEAYPWRLSGDQHVPFLQKVLNDPARSADEQQNAWQALLMTRSPKALEVALSPAALAHSVPAGHDAEDWATRELAQVGLRREGDQFQPLYHTTTYHLIFPAGYFDDQSRPAWRARIHPSWNLPAAEFTADFGGMSSHACALCTGTLHRLLRLPSIPAQLGVTGLTSIELATCLSCLGWQEQPLFYQHDQSGVPSNIAYAGEIVTPEFPATPLQATTVQLAPTPPRWQKQDWGLSNSRESLHRLGGEPSWIQDADYPHCPQCSVRMPFLLQLDSDLPTQSGGEWLWGSGGIGYVFWCDHCKVSATHWQCT